MLRAFMQIHLLICVLIRVQVVISEAKLVRNVYKLVMMGIGEILLIRCAYQLVLVLFIHMDRMLLELVCLLVLGIQVLQTIWPEFVEMSAKIWQIGLHLLIQQQWAVYKCAPIIIICKIQPISAGLNVWLAMLITIADFVCKLVQMTHKLMLIQFYISAYTDAFVDNFRITPQINAYFNAHQFQITMVIQIMIIAAFCFVVKVYGHKIVQEDVFLNVMLINLLIIWREDVLETVLQAKEHFKMVLHTDV